MSNDEIRAPQVRNLLLLKPTNMSLHTELVMTNASGYKDAAPPALPAVFLNIEELFEVITHV
jgi:hypothetical protein